MIGEFHSPEKENESLKITDLVKRAVFSGTALFSG